LHVLDMYRETIEHPWSIPDDIKAQLDLSSGNDRGRIYRLAPPDFAIPKPPKLSTATTAELVAHLASPHSWWRETAQRLLVERQDKEAAEPLRQLLQTSPQPLARLHALYTLAGLNALQSDDLRAALRDESPGIVRHAIHLAEGFPPAATDLAELAPALAQHADAGVRFQTALWLGSLKGDAAAVESLAQLARRDGNDPYLRAAILSSSHGIADSLALALLASSSPPAEQRGRAEIVRQLAFAAASGAEQGPAKRLLDGVANRNDAQSPELTWAVLAGIGQGAARRKEKLADYLPQLEPAAAQRVAQLLEQVLQIASAADTPPAERLAAIDLLAYLPWSDARPALSAATEPTAPGEVQRSALRVLGTFAEAEIAADLVVRWNKMTPPLREESVALLLSRPVWHEPLVAALESGAIPLAQVSIPHRGRLAALKDAALAERTKILLASVALGPRQEMIGRYEPALAQKSDAARGQVVYRRECANCHRLGGEGHEVGPNLATIVHRSPPEILIHVLDPNREVSPNFLDYAVLLADGRVLTGLIASETDSGLTLRRAEQREDTILRSEIANITSSGKSLMPEGLEQKISVEEMGDLIGFLRQPTSPAP
ncbi:MAG: HEAT repeat domain-containing protein, partial [Pirellulaceae bacterium]